MVSWREKELLNVTFNVPATSWGYGAGCSLLTVCYISVPRTIRKNATATSVSISSSNAQQFQLIISQKGRGLGERSYSNSRKPASDGVATVVKTAKETI